LADNLTDKPRTDAGASGQEADLYGIWLTRQAREMRSQHPVARFLQKHWAKPKTGWPKPMNSV